MQSRKKKMLFYHSDGFCLLHLKNKATNPEIAKNVTFFKTKPTQNMSENFSVNRTLSFRELRLGIKLRI